MSFHIIFKRTKNMCVFLFLYHNPSIQRKNVLKKFKEKFKFSKQQKKTKKKSKTAEMNPQGIFH